MVLLALAATLALGQTAAQTSPPPGQGTVPGAAGSGTSGVAPIVRTFNPLARRTPRAPLTAPAIYGNWRSCGIGGGGAMARAVFTSDVAVLYAHGDASGLYRSDDGGRRWRMLHGALPVEGAPAVRDLSVDPKNPDRVLVLVGDQYAAPQGLYETRDGGRTFRRLLTLAALGNGPFRWTGGLIARDPKEPRTILVGSAGDGVYRSTDDGKTWRQIGAGAGDPNGALANAYLTDLRFDRSDSRRVWATAVPTRTYDYRARGTREYRGGWFVSEDGGRTWIRWGNVAPTEFVQDEARPERLIGLFDGLDVLVSDDRGRNWRPYDEGLVIAPDAAREPAFSDSRFDALTAGPGFQLLATARGTLYRRNTNETAWQQVLPEGTTQLYEGRPWIGEDGPGRPIRFGAATSNVTIDPRDPAHLWLADLFGLYESRDGGKNWDLSMDGIETGTIFTIEGDPGTAPRDAFGTNSVAARTSSGTRRPGSGQIGTTAPASPSNQAPSGRPGSVQNTIPGGTPVVHLGMAEFGYLTSRDGGTTFGYGRPAGTSPASARLDTGRVNSFMRSISAAVWDPARIIASGDPGDGQVVANTLWLSDDRGGTWTRSPMTGLPNREAHTIESVIWDPSRENRAYAAVGGVGGGVFVSTDGGLTWLRDAEGLPEVADLFPGEIWTVGREMALDGDGALVVISRPRSEIYRREEAGFVRVTAPDGRGGVGAAIEGQPNEVAAAQVRGGAFYVATDRGIYRSTDAGRTWTRTLARAARYVAVDRSNPRRVAAGCEGAVLLSDDGGLRWRETDAALPDRDFPRVGFSAGRLLVGTTGSGAFWLPLDSGGYAVAETKPVPRRTVELPITKVGATGTTLDLLEDGSFEDQRRFGQRWSIGYVGRGRLEIESVGGASEAGARSLRLRAVSQNSTGSAAARLVSPPRRFRVTGAAKSSGATAEALVGIQTFDRDGQSLGLTVLFDARNADTWRRFSSDVELPAGTDRANLVVTYAGSGSVSLDDVNFETVSEGVTDPARPLPTDLLANGDFEDGGRIARDWTVGYLAAGGLQISGTPVRPHGGQRALLVRNTGSSRAEGAAAFALLKLPRRFRLEGWARVEGTPGTAKVAVQAFDADGRQLVFTVAIDAKRATEWQSFSTEVELPDDVTSAYLVATFEGTGSLLLDDLRLTTLIERR